MRKILPNAAMAGFVICLGLPSSCLAGPILMNPLLIGAVSYDTGVEPGVNTFDLYNLTGSAISPDGIADAELFSGTLTVDVQGVGDEVFNYNGVDIFGDNTTLASFVPSTDILSAVLSLTLSNSIGVNVFDDNGIPGVTNLEPVSDTILPLNGGTQLTACDGSGSPCSAAPIFVNAAPAQSEVPEPSTLWLLASGLGSVLATGCRFRRK